MGTKITNLKDHMAVIESNTARNIERLKCDVEDVALSTWASDCTIRAHRCAIRALEYGAEHGIDGPACDIEVLTRDDGTIVSAKVIRGRYGPCWLLAPEAEAEFGRKFVPVAKTETHAIKDEAGGIIEFRREVKRGRIMKKLGLHEEKRVVKASEWLGNNEPGFIGGAIHYFAKPENPDWFYRGGR